MSIRGRVGAVAERGRGLLESDVPSEDLPRYVAPLPEPLENLGLNLAWLVVAINLAGTAFGFYYYWFQLTSTPAVMWPFVPDSPVATLLIALALAAWKLDRPQEWLTVLAFFGNIILGGWTVYVHLAFWAEFSYLHPAMRQFLIWSHAAMVVQAFVLHRIADFRPRAVAVATLWYTVDTVVDYFIPVRGELHHTYLPLERDAAYVVGPETPVVGIFVSRGSAGRETAGFLGADALSVAATGAVVLLVVSIYLAMLTYAEKHRALRSELGLGD